MAEPRWNYRVLHRTVETGVPGMEPVDEWVLIEAYYDKDGRIISWSEAGCPASDDSLKGLEWALYAQYQAVAQSKGKSKFRRVLTMADLPIDSGKGASH